MRSFAHWLEIKQKGSGHYKSQGVEPIDLYRDAHPHPTLSVLAVKALTDNIKYSYRMLTKGLNISDLEKIKHYTEMAIWSYNESLPLESTYWNETINEGNHNDNNKYAKQTEIEEDGESCCGANERGACGIIRG